MTAGVYAIINTLTGDRYIGSTRDFEARRRYHQSSLRTGYIPINGRLSRARKEYGQDAFTIDLIEETQADDDSLQAAECRWLRHFAEISREQLYNYDLTGRRPRWLHAGKMKGTKLPGAAGWRIPVEEVERMERGER